MIGQVGLIYVEIIEMGRDLDPFYFAEKVNGSEWTVQV